MALGQIAGDIDGSDTLDLVEDFEEAYWTLLTRTDEGCAVMIAFGKLTTEAKILSTLTRC